MRITAEQAQTTSVDPPSPAANQTKNERISTQSSIASTVEKATTAASTAIVPPTQRQTDVTFRRDSNGRIYYVVSDTSSGQEILEVPPKAVRDVSQGIEDYLKQEQSKADAHVEVKA
jgi:uncharacterized FlaG/YvyC family protein